MSSIFNLSKMVVLQEELDQLIMDTHHLQPSLLLTLEKITALQIEISELYNSTRLFKFWSTKVPDDMIMVEEAADVLHFLLSISIDLRVPLTNHDWKETRLSVAEYENASHQPSGDLYHWLVKSVEELQLIVKTAEKREPSMMQHVIKYNLLDIIFRFIHLLDRLRIGDNQLAAAYLQKNAINHDRQASGY